MHNTILIVNDVMCIYALINESVCSITFFPNTGSADLSNFCAPLLFPPNVSLGIIQWV